MQTTNAVKVFSWRACNDALPPMQNLYKRKIVEEPLCPICHQAEETPGHVLWTCPSAQDAWMLGSKQLQKAAITHEEFGDIFMQMLQRIGKIEICLLAEIPRMLWTIRNKMLYEDSFIAPSILMKKATDFQQMQHQQFHSRNNGKLDQTCNTHWHPPETDWLKINWDVAVRGRSHKIGVGIVVRDFEGNLLVLCLQPLQFCSQATMAEARGLISAVKLCKEFSLQKVVFEGDSLQVVNAVKKHFQENGIRAQVMVDRHGSGFGSTVIDVLQSSVNDGGHDNVGFVSDLDNVMAEGHSVFI
ncbi:hypothetical protein F2P56_026978 [Juglans regia]|uniref:Uncharacterized protein LOC109020950 n=2 Tax=Juglans regia TaxID=51240 RepID=A0A2I4HSC1_JUGRE|nr:uncharacterized protein LOC109020950 [Juglans regia]KAF5451924.1 hypothetical protein F2P56_026978 [Juglans regia]